MVTAPPILESSYSPGRACRVPQPSLVSLSLLFVMQKLLNQPSVVSQEELLYGVVYFSVLMRGRVQPPPNATTS